MPSGGRLNRCYRGTPSPLRGGGIVGLGLPRVLVDSLRACGLRLEHGGLPFGFAGHRRPISQA